MRTMEDLIACFKKQIDQLNKDINAVSPATMTDYWACVHFAKCKQHGDMLKVPFYSQDYYHSLN